MVAEYSIRDAVIRGGDFYSGVTLEEEDLSEDSAKRINKIIKERDSEECVHRPYCLNNLKKGNILKLKYSSGLDKDVYLIKDIKLEENVNSKINVWKLSLQGFNTRKTERISYLNHKSTNANPIGLFTTKESGEFEIRVISDKILVKVYDIENEEELLSRII